MKILKMIGIVLAVIIVLVLVGGFIFLKTLDVNKYVPTITQQVKQSLGRDLKVGRANLQVSLWRGIALEVSGVSLSDDSRFSDQPFVSVDKVFLGVNLGRLLFAGKLQIAEVTAVAPKVTVIRNKDGLINAATLGTKPAGSQGPGKEGGAEAGKAAALPALLVERIKVTDARITYRDEMFSPRIDLTVDHLDLGVKGFSLSDPFLFELKANLFSQEPDVELKGKARLVLATGSIWVSDTQLTLDLAKFSAAKFNEMLPLAAPAGLQDPLKGKLVVSVPEMKTGGCQLQSLKVNATLTGGQLASSLLPLALTDIAVTVEGDAKDLLLKSADLRLAEGQVHATGVVREYMSSPSAELTGKLTELELGKISEAYKLPLKITGKAKADIKLSLAGKTPQEIIDSLQADLTGSMQSGALEGMNLVQAGLGNIPMLPTLWEMVQASLPAETQADLQKGRTVVERVEVVVRLKGMVATVEKAELVTRDVVAGAQGTVNIPESMQMGIDLYLQKNIASVLIQKVPDLAGIQDAKGHLYIPLKLTGSLLKPKVTPDTEYLSRKLIANRGKEALQKVIDKNPEVKGVLNALFGSSGSETKDQEGTTGQPATPSDKAATGQETSSGTSQAVDKIFDSFFKKK